MKSFERFASPLTCKKACFQNFLTTSFISFSKAWSTIKLLLAIIFTYYFTF